MTTEFIRAPAICLNADLQLCTDTSKKKKSPRMKKIIYELLLKTIVWIYLNRSSLSCRKHELAISCLQSLSRYHYQVFWGTTKICSPNRITSLFLISSRFSSDGSPSFRIGLVHLSAFLSISKFLCYTDLNKF